MGLLSTWGHRLILIGLVLTGVGVVWFVHPYSVPAGSSLVTDQPLPTGSTSPPGLLGVSAGPWSFGLPPHDTVSDTGIESEYALLVPVDVDVWSLLVVVITLQRGYLVSYGILNRSHCVGTWYQFWDELHRCDPLVDSDYMVPVSSRGDVFSLPRGGHALCMGIGAIDLFAPGSLYIEWVPEPKVDAWMDLHRGLYGDGIGVDTIPPSLGGLVTCAAGFCSLVAGVVNQGRSPDFVVGVCSL